MRNDEHMQTLDLLTIAQASEILDESRHSTARRVAAGELPSSKLEGPKGAHLLQRSDVLALAARLASEKRDRLAKMESAIAAAGAAASEAVPA